MKTMKKPKDFKAEYAARMERNAHLPLSVRRGHPRPGETSVSGRLPKLDSHVLAGVAKIKAGATLTGTARSLGISREKLRSAVAAEGDYRRAGRRYRFFPRVRNDLPLYSKGESIRVLVDEENARLLGEYMAAVRKFLRTQKLEHLKPFIGGGVTDIKGVFHPFETDPEELYRLDTKGRAVFHQIYQLSN
jgi:hypothetical protein